MPSEREQRVRAALNTLLSAQYEVSVADPLSLQLRPLALARNDAFEAVVAIACEPEAAPDAAAIEAWQARCESWISSRTMPCDLLTATQLFKDAFDLMRRSQPATANELAIRELEAVLGQDPSFRIRCWLEQPSLYTREMVAVLRFAVAVLGDKVGPALAHDKKFVWQCKCGCKNIVAICSKCSIERPPTNCPKCGVGSPAYDHPYCAACPSEGGAEG